MSDEREQRDLEARVRELEATVETLTSELVDTTERIRELEVALDTGDGADVTAASGKETASTAWVPATEDVDGEDDAASSKSADQESVRDRDDIIVA